MKHLKTYEKKKYKKFDYEAEAISYIHEILAKEDYLDLDTYNLEDVRIYEEDNKINIKIKWYNAIDKKFLEIFKKYLGDTDYLIVPSSPNTIVTFFDIDRKFLEPIDIRVKAKKYNL